LPTMRIVSLLDAPSFFQEYLSSIGHDDGVHDTIRETVLLVPHPWEVLCSVYGDLAIDKALKKTLDFFCCPVMDRSEYGVLYTHQVLRDWVNERADLRTIVNPQNDVPSFSLHPLLALIMSEDPAVVDRIASEVEVLTSGIYSGRNVANQLCQQVNRQCFLEDFSRLANLLDRTNPEEDKDVDIDLLYLDAIRAARSEIAVATQQRKNLQDTLNLSIGIFHKVNSMFLKARYSMNLCNQA